MPAYGVLCKHLEDVLMYYGAADSVSLTGMPLMAGRCVSTLGFLTLVQYVATLCHLHSIAIDQLQFRLCNQQILDVSQAHFLAYGHKSLVVQLGAEDAVYKVQCTHALLSPVLVCSPSIYQVFLKFVYECYGIFQPLSSWRCELLAHTISWFGTKS